MARSRLKELKNNTQIADLCSQHRNAAIQDSLEHIQIVEIDQQSAASNAEAALVTAEQSANQEIEKRAHHHTH